MSKTFCAVPWKQLSTKPNGNIRICCLMSNSSDPDKGVLRRKDQSIYNARDKDFMAALDEEKIKKLRTDLLNENKNSLCKTCWEKEDVGLKSKRIVTNKMFKDEIENNYFKKITNEDGSINETSVSYLDLRFGNNCNLKCIMCHPASSSKWYNDYIAINNTTFFRDTGQKVQLEKSGNSWVQKDKSFYTWYSNKHFWQQIEEQIKNLKQIYLVGGEPLLINEHFWFLEQIIAKGYAQNITLEYDTNLTVLNPKILNIWKQFKRIMLRVSIESTGKVNDYIRYPSKWTNVKDNISKVEASLSNLELDFSITWQIYNLFSITSIWELFPQYGTVRFLSSPEYLDIRILPKKLKLIALERLNEVKGSPKILNQVDSMKNYLNKHIDYQDADLLKKFMSFTNKTDQLRGLSFEDQFPILYEHLIDFK